MPSLTVEPQFRFVIGHPLTIAFECRDIGYGVESGVLEGHIHWRTRHMGKVDLSTG